MSDGKRQKTIAFVSCAPHQSRLFAFLRGNLPADVGSTMTNVNLLPLTLGFWAAALRLAVAPRPSAQVTDPIIALDYRKYRVNRAAFLRPLDGLVERLWRSVAAIYLVLFRARLRAQKADLLVVWGGFQLPVAAAVAAARQAGIATLFCENGYLPKTIVMDPKGINAGNSLMGATADFYRAVAVPEERRKGLLDTQLVTRPFKHGAAAAETVALPERFVFLPLQVHDDSQVLLYSPRLRDMASLVRFCAEGVEASNARYGTALTLVVKEHPSDHGRVDYADLRRTFPDAVFTKTTATQRLIENAAAVVTINSTVGIEAMLRLKPVITLGEAFYAVPGLVRPCGAGDDLAQVLRQALDGPVDRDLTEHFLHFLRYEYLVALDRNDLAASDPAPAIARLLKALP